MEGSTLVAVVVLCLFAPLVALIDAAMHAKNKVLWVLLIFFFGLLGAMAWWLAGERESQQPRTGRRLLNRRGAHPGAASQGMRSPARRGVRRSRLR